tara:strand:+ start:192 stop:731 length:540 start_codon:yes stop_codon:yes gene_type:complete
LDIKKRPLEKFMDESKKISLPAKIEAILYLKGRPTSSKEMAELLNKDTEEINKALWELKAGYAQRDTALEINENNNYYSLELRQGLGALVQDLLPADLSIATLRTLATVALKKKILQSELVDLRGSGAYDHIKELVDKNFVERRRQKDGRSFWLTLSEKFHQTFSVLPEPVQPENKNAA